MNQINAVLENSRKKVKDTLEKKSCRFQIDRFLKQFAIMCQHID